MKTHQVWAIISLVVAAMPAGAQTKRSVAVDDFEYSAVKTDVQAIFNTQVDIGKGINALMVNRIAKLPNFTVVERAKVNTVLKEQDFGASGRVKKGTQARTGQIRGADYTLMGDIVVFGRDDKSKSVYGGGGVPGAAGVGGVKRREDKAVVVFAYRLVDNESSEIILSGEARGESKRSSTSGFAGFWAGPVIAGGGFNFASQNFAETIIGEATIDACDKLAQDIAAKAGQVPKDKEVEIEALVAAVEGGVIYINAGSSAGVKVGDKFAIQHVVKEVRDPVTKEVLDSVVEPVGVMTVTQVREKVSVGSLQGGGSAKAGDKAEKQ